MKIGHVSDTALMVAACRALETEAADGFIKDSFAAKLAGERSLAILKALPNEGAWMRFGVGVRTRLLDELLLEALKDEKIATVLNVGCGLDSRPWRLPLRPELRWVEVDFPEMLDYKESVLGGDQPRCRRERLTADLRDPEQRRALYQAAGDQSALIITEGLLMYLPAETVDALSSEASRDSSIEHWIVDITTSTFSKMLNLNTQQSVGHVRASDALEGEDILAALHRHGWNGAGHRSYIKDAAFARERGARLATGGDKPAAPPPPSLYTDPTGVHYLRK